MIVYFLKNVLFIKGSFIEKSPDVLWCIFSKLKKEFIQNINFNLLNIKIALICLLNLKCYNKSELSLYRYVPILSLHEKMILFLHSSFYVCNIIGELLISGGVHCRTKLTVATH